MLLALLLALSDGPREFNTPTEAAIFAFIYIAHTSEYYEYGGQIVQLPDGKYAVSRPVTNYEGDHVAFSADPDDYEGKIVASYHTHPCLPFSHIPDHFSTDDLVGSRAFNRPIYMLDFCTGNVHYWAPGDPVEQGPVDTLIPIELAVGKIVGHVEVSGKPLEQKG
jgi:hypothetical protein